MRWCEGLRGVSAGLFVCLEEANLRKDEGEGMVAVEAYREILAENEKPGYFSAARMELAYFGLGDALRGQRHYRGGGGGLREGGRGRRMWGRS